MAVAAQRCGAATLPVMKTGDDEHGHTARRMVLDEGMSSHGIFTTSERPSGAGVVLLGSDGQNSIAIDAGANSLLTPGEIRGLRTHLATCRVFLAQLESPVAAVMEFFQIARELGGITLLNPAPAPLKALPEELWRLTDCLTPNQTEAAALSGCDPTNEAGRRAAAGAFRRRGIPQVVLTLGAAGAFVSTASVEQLVAAPVVNAVDTTGAGDAFNGGLAARLALGSPLIEAVKFGVRYAAFTVTRRGTAVAMPRAAELYEAGKICN